MDENNVVETWLNTVSYSHSGSEGTQKDYEFAFRNFCDFIGKTPKAILDEYKNSTDRKFKRIYATYLRAFIQGLQKEGYGQGTIRKMVFAIKSFLKYNDLPVGFVPTAPNSIEFNNRDITKDEIIALLRISTVRDKAFYVVMAQSGLRPDTLAHLKIKDIPGILDNDTPIPALVQFRRTNTKGKFSQYFSFLGKESVAHLKNYFRTRGALGPDSWVFAKFGHEDEPINGSIMTHMFRKSTRKLRAQGVIDYETYEKRVRGKTVTRSEIKLYCLRKYFRKNAGIAGAEFVDFWMGHTKAMDVDLHYFPRDREHHRKIYAEKAMPFLRLETSTPSETEQTILELRRELEDKDKRIEDLEGKVFDIDTLKQEVVKLRDEEERIAEFLWAFQGKEHLFYDAFEKALQEKTTEARIEEYEEMRNKVFSQCRDCKKYTPHKYESLDRENEIMVLVCDSCGAKKYVPILHKRENLRDG